MFQFFTTMPIPVNLKVNEEDFGKGLIFAPIVGLFIGCLISVGFFLFESLFPLNVTAALTLVLYIIITGGLHLDGLGDTFDGLFSNRSKERMLEIMRDSRVGTNAVLAVSCLLLFNFTMISSLNGINALKILVLMPVSGRIGSLIGAGISCYARSGQGLGKSFIDCCGPREIFAGVILYIAIFYGILGLPGIIIGTVPCLSAVCLTWFFSKKIGGTTGDILGAVCELNQAVFLMTAYIFLKAMPL